MRSIITSRSQRIDYRPKPCEETRGIRTVGLKDSYTRTSVNASLQCQTARIYSSEARTYPNEFKSFPTAGHIIGETARSTSGFTAWWLLRHADNYRLYSHNSHLRLHFTYYALSPVRLSVCLSVTRVYHRKTVEVRIMKFSPYSSPIPLLFAE